MATHSSILAWRIPWTEEPGRLQPMGSQELDTTQQLNYYYYYYDSKYLGELSGKDSACQCRSHRKGGFHPWGRKSPWRRKWQPTPVFLLGKSHGQRSLVGYCPWGRKESDTTEVTQQQQQQQQMNAQVALVVKNLPIQAGDLRDRGSIPGLGTSPGGGNGNPLQYSYLENPMDKRAWQATVYGVTNSRTQLSY